MLSVPALVAVALALTPLFVKVLGRHAGWPIVAFFVAAIVQLARLAGGVLDGDAVTWGVEWAGALLPGEPGWSSRSASTRYHWSSRCWRW